MRTSLEDIPVRMMRLAILVALAFGYLVPTAFTEEYSLTRKVSRDPAKDGINPNTAKMEILSPPPKGLALPDGLGADVIICKWTTPMGRDGFVYVAFGKSGKNSWRDRIAVDCDCDGDLADEKPVEAYSTQGKMDLSYYGPIEMSFPAENGTVSYHAVFGLYAGMSASRNATARSACWREAEITRGETTCRVVLIDANSNGTFNDTSMNLADCDHIAVVARGEKLDPYIVGRFVNAAGDLCLLKASRDGARLELTDVAEMATGTVVTKGDVSIIVIAGENGELPFILKDNRANVPAGEWKVKEWRFAGDPAQGKNPAFGDYRLGEETAFEVAEGRQVVLDIGAKVKPHFEMARASDSTFSPGDLSGAPLSGSRSTARSVSRLAVRRGGG